MQPPDLQGSSGGIIDNNFFAQTRNGGPHVEQNFPCYQKDHCASRVCGYAPNNRLRYAPELFRLAVASFWRLVILVRSSSPCLSLAKIYSAFQGQGARRTKKSCDDLLGGGLPYRHAGCIYHASSLSAQGDLSRIPFMRYFDARYQQALQAKGERSRVRNRGSRFYDDPFWNVHSCRGMHLAYHSRVRIEYSHEETHTLAADRRQCDPARYALRDLPYLYDIWINRKLHGRSGRAALRYSGIRVDPLSSPFLFFFFVNKIFDRMVHIDADKARVKDDNGPGVAKHGINEADESSAHIDYPQLYDRGHHHRDDDKGCAYIAEYFKKYLIVFNEKFHICLCPPKYFEKIKNGRLQKGSQPFTVVGRSSCPYHRIIPIIF